MQIGSLQFESGYPDLNDTPRFSRIRKLIVGDFANVINVENRGTHLINADLSYHCTQLQIGPV